MAQTVETGKIICGFYESVTQQEISDFIDEHNLEVVFSSFEEPDPGYEGNGIAVFVFAFDQTEYTTLESALAGFAADSLVEFVMPNVLDHFTADYQQGVPTDAYYRLTDMRHLNIYDVDDSGNGIDVGPPDGGALSRTAVAVIDDGVYRDHPDFAIPGDSTRRKISRIGMNCYSNGTVYLGNGAGTPSLWDSANNRYATHGTAVAGVICSTAQTSVSNAAGVAGLSPNCGVFPIRCSSYWYNGVEKITTSSIIQAITALRKKLGLGTYYEDVRVVNISVSSSNFEGQANFVERLIERDIKRNDRLYVGSAGNDRQQCLRYPAAYDKVLGVSGFWTTSSGQYWYASRFDQNGQPLAGNGSNYWNDYSSGSTTPWLRKYPVSGIYGFTTTARLSSLDIGYTTTTYCFAQLDPYYASFAGTSFAAPQVSALAALLYDKKVNQGVQTTYLAVTQRIVSTRETSMETQGNSYLAGRVNFMNALAGF